MHLSALFALIGSLAFQLEASAPQAADRSAFEEQLAAAQELVAKRRWRQAEPALLELLQEHAGAEYVRPHLQGLREDVRRAAFWNGVDEPDPKELIAGDLLRYSSGSGRIRLRYDDPKGLADFEKAGVAFVHPMHFADRWTIEVEGSPEELTQLALGVAFGEKDIYVLQFGLKKEDSLVYTKHVAQRLRDSRSETLASADPDERVSEKKKIVGKITVGTREITLHHGGKRAFEVEKPEGVFGGFVLLEKSGTPLEQALTEITIDGEVDRGWLGGLMDEAVSAQRAAFDASWEDPAVFSSWAPSEADVTDDLTWVELFQRLRFLSRFEDARQQELFERVIALRGKGRAQAARTLEQVEGWTDAQMPPAARAFLRFQFAMELRRPTYALELIDQLDVAPEQELDRDLLRAELLVAAGRYEDALAAFRAIQASRPELTLATTRAAESLLLLGRPDEAHALILAGLEAAPGSASLRAFEVKVVKAAKGPSWKRRLTEDGRHFVLYTDTDRETARAARKVLDDAWERCADFFGPLPEGALPVLLDEDGDALPHSAAWLFAGEGSYLAYVKGVADAGHENTLGIYSPALKQIAAWNQADVTDLWDTLRHEVAHRYLDLSLGNRIPRWLNEGLAEAFAASFDASGDYEPGRLREPALRSFRGKIQLLPVLAFAHQTEEDFVATGYPGYAQAWAWVHFLRNEARETKVLERMLSELQRGTDPSLAVDRAFEQVDANELQKGFLAWLQATLDAR